MKLKDKVVVVTGSGNGIGEAFAKRFTAEGAKVVVTDIEADGVDRVAKEIDSVGLAVDITVEANVQAVADLARTTYGRIDVWYSNAGHSGPGQPGDLQDDAIWDLMWPLHVKAHLYAARAVAPEMIERGSGYLIATASSVALSTQAEKVAYSVTKHAALALSEWLAVHYVPKGVKVSCFCPGAMLTRMLLSNDFPADHPIMNIAATPEQVADVLVKGIDAEKFLILLDENDRDALVAKATDYDAYIAQMGARFIDMRK